MPSPEATLEIEITYCADCGYWPRTAWMLGELLTDVQHLVKSVRLVPDSLGLFEWSVNGEQVFSKAATGRFPEMDELRELVYAHVD